MVRLFPPSPPVSGNRLTCVVEQLFSSLYSMLPESKEYLKNDNYSDQIAGLIMMACFTAGFFGIQAISRLVHQFMPTHVVDCDHSHEGATGQDEQSCSHTKRHSRSRHAASRTRSTISQANRVSKSRGSDNGQALETTPLLEAGISRGPKRHASARGDEMLQRPGSPISAVRGRATTNEAAAINRRPSMFQVQKRVMSFVKDTKCNCDEEGSCYGFTDPCGQECFKHITNRPPAIIRQAKILRTTTGPFYPQSGSVFHGGPGHDYEEAADADLAEPCFRTSRARSREPLSPTHEDHEGEHDHESCCSTTTEHEDLEGQHHHHVPTNAFLSIGLQTSIAIALHKFPEGFITYATNHANPSLGFNVFMALFVHNISEGFAMCLPLYMALGSRWRAMLWSAVLGGLSQPLGAGIAVLWIKLADRTNMTPDPAAYACLFAITAGIMVSVALQLFVESLSLNHNRNLCIFFGFLGMAILGLSNALFAGH